MTGRYRFSTVLPSAAVADEAGASLTDGQLLGRFVEGHDTAAFEALVRRHGPMVFGVCKRVLRDSHNAEDAFQATFLVLVRKARSIAPRDALAGWLYGVAHRTALKARALAARRRLRETLPATMPEPAASVTEAANDLRPVLDRELSRLPERYRVPIVLCDLEGMPQKAAAQLLGCPEGTVSGRLTRGRRMLASRLSRHGPTVALSAGWSATPGFAEAAPSVQVVSATVQGACEVMTGSAAAGGTSAGAALLAERVVGAMVMQRIKVYGLVVLGVALLSTAAGGWFLQAQEAPTGRKPLPAQSVTMRGGQFDDTNELLHIMRWSGRVVPAPDRAPNARLVIEVYEGGKKLNQPIEGGGFDTSGVASAWGKPIDFCVQAADLDYLPLGGAKSNHCRVLLKVGTENSASSSTQDIPKDLFNFCQGGSGGAFSASASSGDRVPLFWMQSGSNETYGADSVEKVVSMNQKGKVAIAYLVVQPKASTPK